MRPHVSTSSPELGVEISGRKTRLSPGDVVNGHVYRNRPTSSASARLTIALHGKAQSSAKRAAGYTHITSLGQCNLVDPRKTMQVLQRDEALEIGSEGRQWPFSITVPTSLDSALTAQYASQQLSYLPLAADAADPQPLPSVFSFTGHKPALALGAFVEYYLEAELHLSDGAKSTLTRRNMPKSYSAVLPLRIELVSIGVPFPDVKLTAQTFLRTISSQKLVPGMEDARLSLSQRAQKLVGSSKVPKLVFRALVDVPTRLQLGDERSVPFRVRLEPVWDSTTADVARGAPQTMEVDYFGVKFKATTEIKVVNAIGHRVFSVLHESHGVEVVDINRTSKPGRRIEIPCIGAGKGNPGSVPVDLGHLSNFNLGSATLVNVTKQRGAKLYPDFATYNIRQRHQLLWQLQGTIAGEKVKLDGSVRVTLLPPPPSEDGYLAELEVPGRPAEHELEAPQEPEPAGGIAARGHAELEAPHGVTELETRERG